MNKKIEDLQREFKETKKEISKHDIVEARTEILATNKIFREMINIDPTLMISLAIFSAEIVKFLFDEDKESEEV